MTTGNPLLDSVLLLVSWGLSAYLGAYLGQKGRHHAMKEDLKEILNQTQSEAEAKKRGETEAIQRDLRVILDHLKQTTTLTKQIEADIGHRAWDLQMRVNLKRDLYVRLIETVAEKIRTLNKIVYFETLLRDTPSDSGTMDARAKNHRSTCEANDSLTEKMQAAAAVGCVVLPDDTGAILVALSSRIEEQIRRTASLSAKERATVEASLYQEALNHLAILAKRDLGPATE
jgi:hypothetical protein